MMIPKFRRLDDPSRKLNYDALTYGKLLTLLHRNSTWSTLRQNYPGEPEPLDDQEVVTFAQIDIGGILTALSNKRQKRATRVSPFNFLEYLTQRQYSYKVSETSIDVVISGKVHRFQKVPSLPYYDTSKSTEVGTCDLADNMKIQYYKDAKEVASGIDSYQVDPLTLKHIYIFSQLVYIKNNEWHPVVPINSMVNILPCFECDDIGSVGEKCVAFAKFTFSNLRVASGENVLAGDKLGHYMYTCMDNFTRDQKYRFCHEIATALITIKTNVKDKGTVSVSALLPEKTRMELREHKESDDLYEAKRVAYPATLAKLEKVQSHEVDKSILQAANQYEVNSRSVYTTPTASYVGIQVPSRIMQNIKFRTDFSFFEIQADTDIVVLKGAEQATFVDMVTYLVDRPGAKKGNKLNIKIVIISASISKSDIEHNFLMYKNDIFVHTDLEVILATLSAKEQVKREKDAEEEVDPDIDEGVFAEIKKRTVVIDLEDPKTIDIVSSSLVINKTMQESRNEDYIGRVRKGMTYKSYIFYYPVIVVSKGIEMRRSSMPHASHMIVICGNNKYTFPEWQERVSSAVDIKEYHKVALLANVARMHYFLSAKKVWDYVAVRVKCKSPKFVVPEAYYRRIVKGSVSGVTIDELEAAIDNIEEDETAYIELLERDPTLVLAYAQTHAPEKFSTKAKPPIAVWMQALIYFKFMRGKKGVKLVENIDDLSLTTCQNAVSALELYAKLPVDKKGEYSFQKISEYFKKHLGDEYRMPDQITSEEYKTVIYLMFSMHSKWITTNMYFIVDVIKQCEKHFHSGGLGKREVPQLKKVAPVKGRVVEKEIEEKVSEEQYLEEEEGVEEIDFTVIT